MEAEEARQAGQLGYYARILTQCSLPHSARPGSALERENGRFRLSMLAPPSVGLPYGKVPRLLLAWMVTEAVKTRSPRLDLGPSLSAFMRELGQVPTGGTWGSIGRLREQAKRLFSCTIAFTYDAPAEGAYERLGFNVAHRVCLWWAARDPEQVALFGSFVELSAEFYAAVIDRPVPLDLRAVRALRSPLAFDLFVWASWRMSYLRQETEIPWPALALQFGADYAEVRQFKAKVLRHLRQVVTVYPAARFAVGERGLILKPSPPHVGPRHLAR